MEFVLRTNQHKQPMDRNMAFQDLVQSKGVQKGVYKRCCVMVPIAILPSVCLCYWNLNWIMSLSSSCSSAVPARPQTVSLIVEKLTAECLSAVLPHHLPTLGPALSQPEFILIHAHGKGQWPQQCRTRAQRWHVWRKSWLLWGNRKIISGFSGSTAMANIKLWSDVYGIMNGV